MLRFSIIVGCRELGKRCISSLTGEGALPANLRVPSNLVELSRTKRSLSPGCELPVLRRCEAEIPVHLRARQTWLESLRSREDDQLGLVELHPDVFSVPPRVDILHQVEVWQRNFKRISHAKVKCRAEVRGGGRKPWNQKGGGRARHGSIRSPIWRGGGISHGPRGPTSYYYMLPMKLRVLGLKVALSSKLAQDGLHIVDTLEMPTPEPQYLLDLARYRNWGETILIVDINELPENIIQATDSLKTVNVIPALGSTNFRILGYTTVYMPCMNNKLLYEELSQTCDDILEQGVAAKKHPCSANLPWVNKGLNVHSMLKHETLVLTLEAVNFLEKKLLWHDSRFTPLYPFKFPYSDFP